MDRKEAIRQYKEAATPIGIVGVRNVTTGRTFLATSVNAPAMINRLRFQLQMGSHRQRELQKEWNDLGADAFAIEVLDTIEPPAEGAYDPADDLATLEQMWREKLGADKLYR